MSDGIWEVEHYKADNLKEKIIKYCDSNNLECPKFKQYVRSWELEKIFKDLKNTK